MNNNVISGELVEMDKLLNCHLNNVTFKLYKPRKVKANKTVVDESRLMQFQFMYLKGQFVKYIYLDEEYSEEQYNVAHVFDHQVRCLGIW